jgi:hypothetical protein
MSFVRPTSFVQVVRLGIAVPVMLLLLSAVTAGMAQSPAASRQDANPRAADANAPTLRPEAKVALERPDATTATKAAKPVTPSDRLRAPLPPNQEGCAHLVDNKWVSVPCATEEYKKAHYMPPPVLANSIESLAYTNPLTGGGQPPTVTDWFVWGSVAFDQTSSGADSETNISTSSKGVVTKTANAFSIQTNTNTFPCTLCSNGHPFAATKGVAQSASAPGDTGWVQFVYQQFAPGAVGTGNSRLCVWNVDATIAQNTHNSGPGYASTCVYPSATETVAPLDGAGAPNGDAEVIGYIQCPNPNSNAGCKLWVVAELPWSPGSGWWSISTADVLGLAGHWNNVGGGILGAGGGSVAQFTNSQFLYVVSGYSCVNANATPTGAIDQPCPGPPSWDREGNAFDIQASPASFYPTGESNNLTGAPVGFSCGELACWMSYVASN